MYLGHENSLTLEEVKNYIREEGYMLREEAVEENGWVEDLADILYEEDIVAIFQ